MNIKKLVKSVAFCLLLALCLGFLTKIIIFSLYPLDFEDEIEKNAALYNIPTHFVMAVIKAESNYSPDASSGVAKGLMQLTDETALWISDKMGLTDFSLEKIKEPDVNIALGCFYLKYLFDMYPDKELVLACYNAGPGNVAKWLSDKNYSPDGKKLEVIPFPETREYVKKVLKYEKIYKKLY